MGGALGALRMAVTRVVLQVSLVVNAVTLPTSAARDTWGGGGVHRHIQLRGIGPVVYRTKNRILNAMVIIQGEGHQFVAFWIKMHGLVGGLTL